MEFKFLNALKEQSVLVRLLIASLAWVGLFGYYMGMYIFIAWIQYKRLGIDCILMLGAIVALSTMFYTARKICEESGGLDISDIMGIIGIGVVAPIILVLFFPLFVVHEISVKLMPPIKRTNKCGIPPKGKRILIRCPKKMR